MNDAPVSPWDVTVTVATYRRPELLGVLLRSLREATTRHRLRVVVVDNEPGGTAAGDVVAAAAASGLDAHCLAEPTPGIVAARNAALDAVAQRWPATDAVVFVDDDEEVDPGWLDALVAHAQRSGADVVTGPVVTRFHPDAPSWLVTGGYVQRPSHATGTTLPTAATNNTLVRRALLDTVRFDPAWSDTGGSDTELFGRLHRAGARIEWCAEAVVREEHPLDRSTRRWVWQRGVRVANVRGRLLLADRGRYAVGAEGLVRLLHGLVLLVLRLPVTRAVRYPELTRVAHGVGLLGVATGRVVREYRRPR